MDVGPITRHTDLRPLAGLLVLAIALLVAACADVEPIDADGADDAGAVADAATDESESQAEPVEAVRVRLAVPSDNANFFVYFFGARAGTFAAHGVDLEVERLDAGVQVQGVVSGDLDFMGAGGSAMRAAANEGAPVRVIMFTTTGSISFINAAQEINSVEELRGRQIGSQVPGSTVDLQLRMVLEQHGIDPERDVNIVPFNSPSNIVAAMRAGQIDAGLLTAPFNFRVEALGYPMLVDLDEYVDQAQAAIATSVSMIENDRELVKSFLRGYFATRDYLLSDDSHEEAVAYLESEWELESEVAEGVYQLVRDLLSADGQASDAAMRANIGDDATDEDVARAIDFEPLEEVLAER
jgi:NitT/TauT family transport system substrate-binding protein